MGLSGFQGPRHLGGAPIDLAPCCVNAARFQCLGDRGAVMPPKPKGMHWRTFERHYAELLAADDAFCRWVGVRLAGLL
jgi:hypothetical protein